MERQTILALSICLIPLLTVVGLLKTLAGFSRWPLIAIPLAMTALGFGLLMMGTLSTIDAVPLLAPAYQLLVIGPFLVIFRAVFGKPVVMFSIGGISRLGYALLFLVLILPAILVLKSLEVS